MAKKQTKAELKKEMEALIKSEIPGGPEDEWQFLQDPFSMKMENIQRPSPKDLEVIEKMASYQLSAREIQSILRISQSRWDTDLAMQEAYQRGIEIGKASLRRLQWLSAKRNPIMQIFLGKQYLGQADRVEHANDEGEKQDARQTFADKLKGIIDITPARPTAGNTEPGREGNRPVLLAPVGTGESDRPDERTVVGDSQHTTTDEGVAGHAEE